MSALLIGVVVIVAFLASAGLMVLLEWNRPR
jgi:hypothetical protein